MVKQVIVMRKDLGMRKGKMIAQGSHASMAVLTYPLKNGLALNPESPIMEWLNGSFTKIVLGVNSLEEMQELYLQAEEEGILASMIIDNGDTVFNGVKTPTCIAIGPDHEEKIDKITGHLKLL